MKFSANKYLVTFLVCGVMMLFVFLLNAAQTGISLPDKEDNSYPNSRYAKSNGKIYYRKPSAGYFPMADADPKTFRPFSFNGELIRAGTDQNNVYFNADKIAGLNPSSVTYLGRNYYKDAARVFYGKKEISKATAKDFKYFKGFYAFDGHFIYYKGHVIKDADVHSAGRVLVEQEDQDFDYLRDKNYVYYKGQVISGALPARFTLLSTENDQVNAQYAFDGQHYFYQHKMVLIAGDQEKSKGLKLLAADKDYAWNGIFYQGKTVFCYDMDKNIAIPIYIRDSAAPFVKLNQGVFKDDKHVYFAYCKVDWGAPNRRRFVGRTTGLAIAAGADPNDFREAGKVETGLSDDSGVIYQSGERKYFHRSFGNQDNYKAGLSLIDSNGQLQQLSVKQGGSRFFKGLRNEIWDTLVAFAGLFKSNDDAAED